MKKPSKKVQAIIDRLNCEILAAPRQTGTIVDGLKAIKYETSSGIKIEVVEATQKGDQIQTVTRITGLKVKRKFFKGVIFGK